ncbi:MAG: hypothetical protein SO253_00955 [Bacilli bacterium]|nr:hypothetical protein [Bacilli bacterium]
MTKQRNLIYHLYAYYEIIHNSDSNAKHFNTYNELLEFENNYSNNFNNSSDIFKYIICARKSLDVSELSEFNKYIRNKQTLKHTIYHLIGNLFSFRARFFYISSFLMPLDKKENVIATKEYPITISNLLNHATIFANDKLLIHTNEENLILTQILKSMCYIKESNYLSQEISMPTHYLDFTSFDNRTNNVDYKKIIEQHDFNSKLCLVVKKPFIKSSYFNILITKGYIESITTFEGKNITDFCLLVINKQANLNLNDNSYIIEVNKIDSFNKMETKHTLFKDLISDHDILL